MISTAEVITMTPLVLLLAAQNCLHFRRARLYALPRYSATGQAINGCPTRVHGFDGKNMMLLLISLLLTLSLFTFNLSPSFGLPAEDVQLVTDAQYFQVAQRIIKEAKASIHVMMFEMGYYDQHPNTPTNLLIKELIHAKKRGVKVEVILEVREGEDRTTKRNRHTGKILSDGGVEVIFDLLSKTTHAKSMVVDGRLTLLGSTNWTYYALTNNHEVSVLVQSKELGKALIDYFNQVKSTGTKP
jgi:phosphatidylserine/phosphatidylglycerophosphate/cardiolipin synthase-like enzyme